MEHGVPALWRNIHDLRQVQTRTFHLAWSAFFVCVVAWMGLMPVIGIIQKEMALTDDQVTWIVIATLALSIFSRPLAGWCCDMFGPRKTYSWILIFGSAPVFLSGFAWNFESLLISRALVGCIGGAFVVTVYHTTMMFAPNIVGQAAGVATGWGTFGAASSHLVLPATAMGMMGFGFFETSEWRLTMIVTGCVMIFSGWLYLMATQDTPLGNFDDLRAEDLVPQKSEIAPCWGLALRDHRVWMMAVIYGVCVGLEIAVISFGSLYFIHEFGLGMVEASLIIAAFGFLNLIGRGFGGFVADRYGGLLGLRGRSLVLFTCLLFQGATLMLFSQSMSLVQSTILLLGFSICTQMAEGSTYAITPFMKRGSLGSVSGIVAGGGTLGALLACLALAEMPSWREAFLFLGIVTSLGSGLALMVRFSPSEENAERAAIAASSLGLIERKLPLLKENLKKWQAKKEKMPKGVSLIAKHWIEHLEARAQHLEDVLEEAQSADADRSHMSHTSKQERMPSAHRHLRIVWDASKVKD